MSRPVDDHCQGLEAPTARNMKAGAVCFAPTARDMKASALCFAPTARDMKARGTLLRANGARYESQGHSASRQRREMKARGTLLRANGARDESQGQARSASPLVTRNSREQGLKGRNKFRQLRPFRAGIFFCFLPGATRFALAPGFHISRRWGEAECPRLSCCAPLALSRQSRLP